MILVFILLTVNAVFCSNHDLLEQDYYDVSKVDEIFQQYMEKYGKHYEDEEYAHRLNVFKDNLVKINENRMARGGDATEINMFTDHTLEEFTRKYLGLSFDFLNVDTNVTYYKPRVRAPRQLDWRKYGYVTPVLDQSKYQDCGSCYIFSAIGNIEGVYAKKHKVRAIPLSVQQALDCDDIDNGCNGGVQANVFTKKLPNCLTDENRITVVVRGGTILRVDSEEDLKHAVAEFGPLAISVRFKSVMNIRPGTIYDCECCEVDSEHQLNHGVVLVGYGTENGKDYWIIKNSWGPYWGERGYAKITRGIGACGIGLSTFLAYVD